MALKSKARLMADSYRPQEGPQFDKQRTPAENPVAGLDDEDLLDRFDKWDIGLGAHWSQWIEDARGWYDFHSGKQWTSNEVALMEGSQKIPVTFNLSAPVIDAVNGAEIQDRQQVQYYPRQATEKSTGISDVLTQGANYVTDQCNGDQEDTEAFLDTLICGLGWTETRVEVEGEVASIIKERVDPLQMKADPASRKRCFEDARYLKREIPMSEDEFDTFKAQINRPDLDMGEYDADPHGKRLTVVNPRQRYTHGMLGDDEEPDVVVCEWQWWDNEPVHVAPMPHPTNPNVTKLTPLSPAQFNQVKSQNPAIRAVKSTKKVFYRAFVADGEILFKEMMPEGQFRYQAITGKRDRNKGTYYGLVKPLVEPNKFVNKLYSEVLHIVRTNANGGMMLEEDAVSDVKQFNDSWASTDKVTWLKSGALSGAHGAKMQAKAPPPVQPALFQMMSFAKDMVQACTGVNEEILGLVGREQPGVLEAQRKQSAYGILSAYFDAKRRYQRNQGRLLLTMMRLYLPEDFMVRIITDGEAQYVPLAMAMQAEEFDVVVDEAPASPNAKARVANVLMPLVPQLIQGNLIGPEMLADLFQYLDIPATVANQLSMAVKAQAQKMAQPNPMAEAAQQAELDNKQADTAQKKATAQGKQAKAFRDVTDAHAQHIGLGVDFLHATTPPGPNVSQASASGQPGSMSPAAGPPGGAPAGVPPSAGATGGKRIRPPAPSAQQRPGAPSSPPPPDESGNG